MLVFSYVGRSDIHGRGLFCKRNIEAGEMVIEYAGIVIRSILTDKREKYYSSKASFQINSNTFLTLFIDLLVFIDLFYWFYWYLVM